MEFDSLQEKSLAGKRVSLIVKTIERELSGDK
jgi:hypothetical protein